MNTTELKALAEDLAKGLLEAIDGPAFHVPHYTARQAAAELRRLAQVEAEHEALLKAISDAVPVAQIRMSDGGLSVVNRVTTKGVQVSVHRADGDWTPLYTLNRIKKP